MARGRWPVRLPASCRPLRRGPALVIAVAGQGEHAGARSHRALGRRFLAVAAFDDNGRAIERRTRSGSTAAGEIARGRFHPDGPPGRRARSFLPSSMRRAGSPATASPSRRISWKGSAGSSTARSARPLARSVTSPGRAIDEQNREARIGRRGAGRPRRRAALTAIHAGCLADALLASAADRRVRICSRGPSRGGYPHRGRRGHRVAKRSAGGRTEADVAAFPAVSTLRAVESRQRIGRVAGQDGRLEARPVAVSTTGDSKR